MNSERCRLRVGADALAAFFEAGEGRDVLLVKLEIEDVEVLLDARRRDGLRNGYQPIVNVPAGDDLRRCAAMLCRNLANDRVFQERALTERATGLRNDLVFLVVGPRVLLWEIRMEFDLVDDRRDTGLVDQALQVFRIEVGDPDGAGAAFLAELKKAFQVSTYWSRFGAGQWMR